MPDRNRQQQCLSGLGMLVNNAWQDFFKAIPEDNTGDPGQECLTAMLVWHESLTAQFGGETAGNST
jgi:hypothetical protein